MKFSMSEQEKGNLLIQVTAWAGLTIHLTIHAQFGSCIGGHLGFPILHEWSLDVHL
jgi:hypothetical protein